MTKLTKQGVRDLDAMYGRQRRNRRELPSEQPQVGPKCFHEHAYESNVFDRHGFPMLICPDCGANSGGRE